MKKRPTLHLICNAHLDPVWQWRWEEGCSEALSTFGSAVDILHDYPALIFNHNEAVLYRWVQQYQPDLFREIRKLVRAGRWCISGGWYLQPDVNLPGLESLIRHVSEGRRFIQKHFDARPIVAYNFDSFGHSGGLPQVLTGAGYRMYIHMRPQNPDLTLPSDLYRWRGVDGSEILTYRIAVGLYHTERDNILQRLEEGTELALRLNRDVPVFWGIGNHGGGATREDLEKIEEFSAREKRVFVVHSTAERLYRALKPFAKNAPVVTGDLQRVFTGCYTSIAALKHRAGRSLAGIVQTEALAAATWWSAGVRYPSNELADAWRDHLFNDCHDILPGSCTESAALDALDSYGRASETSRRLRLNAVNRTGGGTARPLYVPVTVANGNPSLRRVPVEVECMLDLRPKWTGTWHLTLHDLSGNELSCQEEQPESLLPFNGWRRKVTFMATLPGVGVAHYEIRIQKGERAPSHGRPAVDCTLDARTHLLTGLRTPDGHECLAGPAPQFLVVADDGDSWGADRWSYRDVLSKFDVEPGSALLVHDGSVRSVDETVLNYHKSSVVVRTIRYADFPAIELRLRIQWNEERARLKLALPTTLHQDSVWCEVPGGAIARRADGQEHVHGRWCMLGGEKENDAALGIVHDGAHGFDAQDGEIRFSILRSAAYCHEQGFSLGTSPARKYMDQGVHERRFLLLAGSRASVLPQLACLADWLAAPPAVYAHLPIRKRLNAALTRPEGLLRIDKQNIRVIAMKRSWDGKSLVIRFHETSGVRTRVSMALAHPSRRGILTFAPFEIKTVRIERSGRLHEVALIEEV